MIGAKEREANRLLDIKELTVEVEGREILHDINLTIRTGETHVLFGPNGSGKTTLIMTIMSFPKYKVTRGSILFQGKDITGLTLNERACLGIGVSFQRRRLSGGKDSRNGYCLSQRAVPLGLKGIWNVAG